MGVFAIYDYDFPQDRSLRPVLKIQQTQDYKA